MKPEIVLAYEFVEYIPEELKEHTLYVSRQYGTAVHKCCCGCGREVVTPLSPTGWRLTFDGNSVSLYPSIGSWSLPCQSHYLIRSNRVVWAPQWSQKRVARGRAREALAKERYFEQDCAESSETPATIYEPSSKGEQAAEETPAESVWQRIKRLLFL